MEKHKPVTSNPDTIKAVEKAALRCANGLIYRRNEMYYPPRHNQHATKRPTPGPAAPMRIWDLDRIIQTEDELTNLINWGIMGAEVETPPWWQKSNLIARLKWISTPPTAISGHPALDEIATRLTACANKLMPKQVYKKPTQDRWLTIDESIKLLADAGVTVTPGALRKAHSRGKLRAKIGGPGKPNYYSLITLTRTYLTKV